MVNNTNFKQLFRTHGYVMILLVFGAMTLITVLMPIVNAAAENMTINSDTSSVTVGVSKDVTFTVTRACGTEPGDNCASINPPPFIPATDVKVKLTGRASGSDITDNNGKVSFSINASHTGVIVATASKDGYNDATTAITVLPNDVPTPTPTPNATTPTPTPTPTPNSTPNATPTPTPNVTTTPTTIPTPTPNLNNTCVDDVSYGDTLNTVVGDGIKFAFLPSSNFTNKTTAWDVSWYVNNTVVKNDPRISNASVYINNGLTIGVWNVTAIATNKCDKSQITWKWTINPKPPAPSSSGGGSSGGSSSGSSSGGGGGGGVSSPESYNNIDHFMSKSNDIFAGKSVAYQFTLPNFAIYEIDVIGNLSDNDVGIRLEHLKNISFTADKIPAGIIYANENVWINSKRISSIHIKFKVPKSWIKNNNLNNEDIKLLKYDGNWWKLNTKVMNNDSDYIYYEAMTNSQSVFAISGLKDSIKYAEKIDNSTDTSLQPLYNSTNQSNNVSMKPLNTEPVESTKMMVGIGVIILVLVIVSYGITQIRKHLKKKEGT